MRYWSPLLNSQLSTLDSVLCNILPRPAEEIPQQLQFLLEFLGVYTMSNCISSVVQIFPPYWCSPGVERPHKYPERSPFTIVVGKGPHFSAERKDVLVSEREAK